jgi:hypothetical protein
MAKRKRKKSSKKPPTDAFECLNPDVVPEPRILTTVWEDPPDKPCPVFIIPTREETRNK